MVRVGAVVEHYEVRQPGTVAGPQDRAQVAGIAHLDERYDITSTECGLLEIGPALADHGAQAHGLVAAR